MTRENYRRLVVAYITTALFREDTDIHEEAWSEVYSCTAKPCAQSLAMMVANKQMCDARKALNR